MHYINNPLHSDYFLRHQPSGLGALRINFVLSQFVIGMISSFGVIFLYQLGGTFYQGIFYVFAFYAAQRILVAFFIPPIAYFTSRVGYRWMMSFGLLALAVKLILLSVTNANTLVFLIPAAIAGAFSIPGYYLPFHALFLDDNDNTKVGEQIGVIEMLGRLVTVFSPFVAGVITQMYGFHILFLVSCFLLFVSLIPLFGMKRHAKHAGSYSFAKVQDFVNSEKKTSFSLFFLAITVAINIFFWPIFLFKVLGNYELFGFVGSLVMIMNSAAVYLTGKLYDKNGHRKFYETSAFVVVLTWIARFVSVTPLTVIIADVTHRVASPPFWMKIRRYELVKGEKHDSLVYGAAHEFLHTFGLLAGTTVGFCLLALSGGAWVLLVFPALIGTFAPTVLLKDE